MLEQIRKKDKDIPFIICAGSSKQEYIIESKKKGAQGCTGKPDELVELVIKNLLN